MLDDVEAYLVGGAVRDRLLGLIVRDRDWVVVGSTVEQMLARGFTQVGRDFPVFLHPESKEEYALARTERKAGTGHTGFVVHADAEVTLEQDLERRDLTINAMAEDAHGGLIDPFGGQTDLHNRLLRHVSDAFTEDPLRVFRVARFAAQLPGFAVAEETQTLLTQMCAKGELRTLSAERVWQEVARALDCQEPDRFFQVLNQCGGLADWLPELVDRVDALDLGEGEGDFRFARLPLDEAEYRSLHKRLKAPGAQLLLGLDMRQFGAALTAGNDPHVLCEAFEKLKVGHSLDRYRRLSQMLNLPDQIEVLALAFADTELLDPPAAGPEFGRALRAARLAKLGELLD